MYDKVVGMMILAGALALAGPAAAKAPGSGPGATGLLLVNTMPWSRVYVDGRLVGNTPLRLRVAAGVHRVELRGPSGTTRRVRRVKVVPNRSLRMVYRFRRSGATPPPAPGKRSAAAATRCDCRCDASAPSGSARTVTPRRSAKPATVRINTVPPTRVMIDGRFVGLTPVFTKVPAGRHRLRLEDRRTGRVVHLTVNARAGTTHTIIRRLR